MADFVEFMVEAEEHGIRVLIDLVANHTSNEHPWFQAARHDRESRYRNYYIWREDEPEDTSDQVVFPGEAVFGVGANVVAGTYFASHAGLVELRRSVVCALPV